VKSTVINGFLAGVLATAPMTVAMVAMHRRLPLLQRYPLPPRILTWRVTGHAGTTPTLLCHFAYGGGAGAVYALTVGRLRGAPLGKGVGYGLLVWAGSYLGLLPALGLYPSATKAPAKRNLLMIAAHVVWGAILGMLISTPPYKPRSGPPTRITPDARPRPTPAPPIQRTPETAPLVRPAGVEASAV
jgi:uncharacterized membrane protein YagU involved in acid resistance